MQIVQEEYKKNPVFWPQKNIPEAVDAKSMGNFMNDTVSEVAVQENCSRQKIELIYNHISNI